MKKQLRKPPETKQEKLEDWYHDRNPQEFDSLMSQAATHSPDVIRLPARLTATLKTLAKREGEPEYQAMVTRWLRERVQNESRSVPKLSKQPKRKRGPGLKRQLTK
jgi:hypothetical protein